MLILHRREGEAVFSGFNLDSDNLEGTFDHHVVVKEVGHQEWAKYVELHITTPNGETQELTLTPGVNSARITPDLELIFLGTREYMVSGGPAEVSARIGYEAPRSYRIVRDNARKNMGRAAV